MLQRLRGTELRAFTLEFAGTCFYLPRHHQLQSILNEQVQLLNDKMHGLLHPLGNLNINSLVYVLKVVFHRRFLALLQEVRVLKAQCYGIVLCCVHHINRSNNRLSFLIKFNIINSTYSELHIKMSGL